MSYQTGEIWGFWKNEVEIKKEVKEQDKTAWQMRVNEYTFSRAPQGVYHTIQPCGSHLLNDDTLSDPLS